MSASQSAAKQLATFFFFFSDLAPESLPVNRSADVGTIRQMLQGEEGRVKFIFSEPVPKTNLYFQDSPDDPENAGLSSGPVERSIVRARNNQQWTA